MITPIAQISALESYAHPLQTSGGMNKGVPKIECATSSSLGKALEIPKSPSLSTPFLMKIF
jgi:hypothetical protein